MQLIYQTVANYSGCTDRLFYAYLSTVRVRPKNNLTLQLLALPYEPNLAEWLMLANRRILADQQAFLQRLAPRRRRF